MSKKKVRVYKKGGAISPEDAAISNVLMNRNRDKNFVDRAYDPNRQSIQVPGQPGRSTHLMEWSDDGSQGYVYPTVAETDAGKLQYLGDNAYNHAMNSGQYIPVPMNKAQMFSEYGYKHASGMPQYKGGGPVDPLYVGSKSNPRYKAYQDSLNTYNQNNALLNKYQHTLVNPEDNAPLKPGTKQGNVTVFPYKNSPTERVLVQNPIMPKQQVIIGNRPPTPPTPPLRSSFPPPNIYGQGDYTVRDATHDAFYRYPTREQADSAVNSVNGYPEVPMPVAHKQYGGDVMKKKIRITGTPTMEFGGALPDTGYNINGGGKNEAVDVRWRAYGVPSDVYAYEPSAYETKSTLPTVPEEQADIVVEKQEQVIGDFDGDGNQELMGVDAGSHASGNDAPVNVPDGAFVYSDTKALKIKDKDVLKQFGKSKASTPAQLAKQYDLQKYSAIMQNPDTDPMAKKTAQMMYDNYKGKLDQIGMIQEGMKAQMEQKKQQKQMKYGGIPEYPTGGPYSGYYGYPDIQANQQDVVERNPQAAWFASNVMGNPAAGTLVDSKNGYRTQFMNAANTMSDATPGQDNIQPLETYPPSVPGTPQPTPMSTLAIPGSTQQSPIADTGSGKRRVRIGVPGMNPDQLGDLTLGLKAGSLQKFKPWEPPVTAVIPEATYLDPTRELAANSEQAAMAYNAANQSANSKAARSAAGAYQGQALKNAADILGRYNNSNVQIANQANQQAAAITNQMLEGQRERAKSLNSDMFNANRLYQGELNQLSDEMVKRAYQKEDSARNRAWVNQTNPYYQLDSRGFPVFNSQNAADKFNADMQKMNSGQPVSGTGKEKTYKDWLNYYTSTMGVDDPEEAKDLALGQVAAQTKVARTRTQYDKSGNVKGTTVTAPKQKMGGFTTNQLRKFIENRGGY